MMSRMPPVIRDEGAFTSGVLEGQLCNGYLHARVVQEYSSQTCGKDILVPFGGCVK